jgi:hypothetical protein
LVGSSTPSSSRRNSYNIPYGSFMPPKPVLIRQLSGMTTPGSRTSTESFDKTFRMDEPYSKSTHVRYHPILIERRELKDLFWLLDYHSRQCKCILTCCFLDGLLSSQCFCVNRDHPHPLLHYQLFPSLFLKKFTHVLYKLRR